MEFTKEFIEEHKLNEDQIKAVSSFTSEAISNLKNEWDGKANENAEQILSGAVSYFKKQNGIEIERQQGEKYGDYIKRATGELLKDKTTELEKAKADYAEKMKNFKGGEDFSQEIEKLKKEKDELLQKYANFDEITEKAQKYESTAETLSGLKLELAFGNIKPNFPKEVNEYEAAAKWEKFKQSVLEKFNIELDGTKPIAVDKENKHRVKDLKDLLDSDETIKALMKGRQQEGTGAETRETTSIKDVPFEVPINATTKEISKLIQDHLAKKGVGITDPKYSSMFSELNKNILLGKKQ